MTEQPKPCPFCGSTDLIDGMLATDDGEYETWHCRTCLAEAPQSVWNDRPREGADGPARILDPIQALQQALDQLRFMNADENSQQQEKTTAWRMIREIEATLSIYGNRRHTL